MAYTEWELPFISPMGISGAWRQRERGDGKKRKTGRILLKNRYSKAFDEKESAFSHDDTKLIISNLAGKLLERIDYDAATDTFTFNKAATLDLVGGRDLTAWEAEADSTLPAGRVSGTYHNFQTTHTPSGALEEGPGRPNNVVVRGRPSSNHQHAYLTLGGGGGIEHAVRMDRRTSHKSANLTPVSLEASGVHAHRQVVPARCRA